MQEMNNTQAAINAGIGMTEHRSIEGHRFAIVPDGAQVQDLEHLQLAPTRKRGIVSLRDTGSFITVVNADKTPSTRLYGSYTNPQFMAVFNDHADTPAGWQDHRAVYACPTSVEWKTWTAQNGKQMSQVDFAQFIENNLPDVADPPAADMLEISRSLEAKKKVNFASGIRLANGQNELTYEEEVSGTAAKGKLQVPELFTIGIPVLEGGHRYAVQARLRYRIQDGGRLTIWFELVRPHKILEDAVHAVWIEIQDKTGLTVLNGGL